MHVSVGDSILSAGVVTGTERVKCTGLVAPVTRAGTIVVNGVITSDCKSLPHLVRAAFLFQLCRWPNGADAGTARYTHSCNANTRDAVGIPKVELLAFQWQ